MFSVRARVFFRNTLFSIKPKTISMGGYLSKIPGAERRGIVSHEPVSPYRPVNNIEGHMNITVAYQYEARFSGRTLAHEPKTCLVFCI